MGCSRGEGVAQLQRFALDVHNPKQLKERSEEPGMPPQPAAGLGRAAVPSPCAGSGWRGWSVSPGGCYSWSAAGWALPCLQQNHTVPTWGFGLQKQHWNVLRSSGVFGTGFVCSLLGKDKAFSRRAYLGSAPVLLGAGFPLPFPVLAATQVSMESFGCAPFPASVQGTFPIPATLLLLDSAVSTWSKFRLAALVHRLKEIMQWELISKGCSMSKGVFVTVVALTSVLAGGHK